MRIVEEKVKPDRLLNNRDGYRKFWWQFAEKRAELQDAIANLDRFIVNCQVAPHVSFAFLPARTAPAHTLNVYPMSSSAALCVLQCRVHEGWARLFASSMKDDLRYTPSDCFETFPFPEKFETHIDLELVGQAYYEFRAALMVRNNEGLTKTYNRFHDPSETSADIIELRELHASMDRAVFDAYGGDLGKLTVPPCEFLLDYEDEDDEDGEPPASTPGGRQKKKPWRYRWPDSFRDEVLALLLELNKARAEQEKLTALPAAKPKKARTPRKKASNSGGDAGTDSDGTPDLF